MSTPLPLSEAFEIYRTDYIVYNNQAKKTEEMHNLALKSIVEFLGDIDIHSLTFQHIRDWKEFLTKSKGQNTVRGYILKLRVVVVHLKMRGFNLVNPNLIGVPRRKTVKVDFLTEEEVSKFIAASFQKVSGYSEENRYRNRAIISLLYASGIRVSELCNMNISDLKVNGTFVVCGKGDKTRPCFYDARSKDYIDEYLDKFRGDNNIALFTSDKTKKRISKDIVQMIFRTTRTRAGFNQPVHPHTMRHSFATNLLRNNANLLYVRDFLGHSSISTTEMYTHVVQKDLENIYAQKHTV